MIEKKPRPGNEVQIVQGTAMWTQEGVISSLLKGCPGFAKTIDSDDIEEGPYSILGIFALYLRDGITSGTLSSEELDLAFGFLNEMGEIKDEETQTMLAVGVLEILTDTDESIAVTKRNLNGQASELFIQTLSWWYDE